MNQAERLRAEVAHGGVSWESIRVTNAEAFGLMCIDGNMHHIYRASRVVVQMWMLFFAEYFESEYNKTM